MKKYLLYSLILHILLISLGLFLVQEKKEKGPAPFYARIITPDEMQKEQSPVKHRRPQPLRRKNVIALPQLPQNLPPPVSRSSIPDPAETTTGDKSPKEGAASRKQEKQTSGPEMHETDKRAPSVAPQQKTFREKLFDRDIIGKLAQKKKEDKKTDNRITLNTKGYKYYGYEQMVANKMLDKWDLPLDYKYKGIAGVVEIGYTIRKNGTLGNIEILRTSGHQSLDSAAIKAIKDGEPYWPLPDEWGEDSYTSSMHFTYEPFDPRFPGYFRKTIHFR